MKKFLMRRLGVSDDPTALKPSLHDCIEAVLEQSDALMNDVLNGLDIAANQSKSKASQRSISQTLVQQLRDQADAVRATFGVQLRLAIYHSGSHDTSRETLVRFEDLQLLDEAQINTNIEYAQAQQEIQQAVDDVLPPLNMLISSLLGWMSVQAHLNPLRPESFARALRETLVQHVPSEEARISLMTPAGGILGASLRQFYKELTDWLRSQGIEPVVLVSASPNSDAASGKAAQNSVSRTMLTLDKLRRLLSGELDADSDGGPKGFLHTVPFSMQALEDMKMVEPMMKRLHQRAAQAPAAGQAAGAAKTVTREKTKSRKLGQQLGEEVVRLMLDNLMQDERLLPKVREQVKALEPVFLSLSKTDPRFFSERKHPARKLLDRITHLSLGYQSEREEGFYRFLEKVEAGVQELASGQGEAESFARVLMTLEAQWSRDDLARKPRQEEAARALMHAEQRNLLAHRLAADFQERMQDKEVPELVATFLCGPWAQVIAESQLSRADGSADAEGYLALVDELIWSVQFKLTQRNRARLVKLVPTLLVRLRQGLQLIEYPQERIPHLFDELISFHEKAFEGPRAAAPVAPDRPAEEIGGARTELEPQEHGNAPAQSAGAPDKFGAGDGAEVKAFWLAEHEASEAGYLPEGKVTPDAPSGVGLPRSSVETDLAIGAWVELKLESEWVRAQLTWASPHRTLFMFISGQGQSHSMSRRTMERLRSQGQMRVVAESHVVDNALDAVAQTALRNDRAVR